MSRISASLCSLCLIVLLAATPALAEAPDKAAVRLFDGMGKAVVASIDCNTGESINDTLAANPDLTELRFSGTCVENVLITRDDLALIGLDGATIEGNVVLFHAAGIDLVSFNVTGSPLSGIGILANSEATVADVTIEDCFRGLLVESSVLDIRTRLEITNSTTVGLLARDARVSFFGDVQVNNNGFINIAGDLGTAFSIADPNAVVQANGSFAGFVLQLGSNMIFGGGQLVANDNSFGILVSSNATFVYAVVNIEASGNAVAGLSVDGSSIFDYAAPGGAMVSFSNNTGDGVQVGRNSIATFGDAVEISGNGGFGLVVDEGAVTVAATTIENNTGGDVRLDIASASRFGDGNTIGTIECTDDIQFILGAACVAPAASRTPATPAEAIRLPFVLDEL